MKSTDTIIDLAFRLSRIMRQRMFKMRNRSRVNMMQLHMLGWIAESRGVTMKELAEHLKISSPSATVFVQRLVVMGLLHRFEDPKNRKLVRLKISRKGQALCREHMQTAQDALRKIFSIISPSDQRELARILDNLVNELEQHDSSHS
ncbi:MAG TPA: MarR family transcriptional regulator [Candidatus Peribacteraceae bacterium]|nr:MarR family transcriptional regulator [Candidatus Peribacteraceae bacterium]